MREKVSEISAAATGEYSLELAIAKIRSQWDKLMFSLLPYNDTFILGK